MLIVEPEAGLGVSTLALSMSLFFVFVLYIYFQYTILTFTELVERKEAWRGCRDLKILVECRANT